MRSLSDYLLPIHARAPAAADADFLAQLYAATRADLHSASADPAFVKSLIEMQQRLQMAGYRHSFPQAEYLLLEFQGHKLGRIVVDIGPDALRLLDIALCPALRGQGFGTRVLQALQQYAAGHALALTLAVHHGNPNARRLYAALGFQTVSRNEVSEQMIWNNEVRSRRAHPLKDA